MSASGQIHESLTSLNPRELDVLQSLPGTSYELADTLDLDPGRVRSYVSSINSKVPGAIEKERDGRKTRYTRSAMSQGLDAGGSRVGRAEIRDLPPEELVARTIPTEAKTTITREYKRYASEIEAHAAAVVSALPPAIATEDAYILAEEYEEDIVIHRSDDHIGEVRTDSSGREIFNPALAADAIQQVTLNAIAAADRMSPSIGTAHLLVGGDTITGETIHHSQPHEIGMLLTDQVESGMSLYFQQIVALSDAFPRVQVVCQPGNHGELRSGGQSDQANADLIAYRWLDSMVRLAQQFGHLDNVTFINGESANFTNFHVRGHRAHLRHGQDSLSHIGTNSAQKKWLHWKDRYGYTLGFRGHYHEFRVEPVNDAHVIESGSICPPKDYEDSLAVYSQPTATVVGVSDYHPLEWVRPIFF